MAREKQKPRAVRPGASNSDSRGSAIGSEDTAGHLDRQVYRVANRFGLSLTIAAVIAKHAFETLEAAR